MDRSNNSSSGTSRRWTCEACGCNTNSESDRSCSICGTSNGSSLLRRVGYAARPGLFARSLSARRSFMNEELGMEGYELWERADDDMEIHAEDEEHAIAALAMEVAGVSGRDAHRQRSVLEAARSFAMAPRETVRPDPSEILRAAYDNGALYQPRWMNPSQIGGRMRTGNGIEVGDGENQNVAHLPLGSGEGRALRSLEQFPRSAPFASFNLASQNDDSSRERRPRRAFGFRVAFEHPNKQKGKSLGGCYLVGVTTTSFSAFSERNALQQSPFFWGIEDSGNKYSGSRSHVSRDGRRGQSGFAVELSPSEAPRNQDKVLFGSREVVTCVVDFESRSLTFWRDEELLGTLITNLPRGGNLFPIVVPYSSGSTVAICGMGEDPLPLLRSFATDWKLAQQEKDTVQRQKLLSQRSMLIAYGTLTPGLTRILRSIFFSYSANSDSKDLEQNKLSRVEASRLWYRCGMKLSHLESVLATRSPRVGVSFEDFIDVMREVVREDEVIFTSQQPYGDNSRVFQVGDRVELVEGYERFGDASNGPLQPGERGSVVELQEGPTGDRHSVRVLHNSRRWWYQPQAVAREKSGLIASPGVWFLRTILRNHGYDHDSLHLLFGRPVTSSSWQVGDIVVPKRLASSILVGDVPGDSEVLDIDKNVGRVVAESSTSSSTLTARGREAGSVLVEFASKSFADAVGVQVGSSFQEETLETRRIPVSRLVHWTGFQGSRVQTKESSSRLLSESRSVRIERVKFRSLEEMDVSLPDRDLKVDCAIGERALADIEKISALDTTAIDNVANECMKNSTTLAGLFASGLPTAVLDATDSILMKVGRSESGESLAQAISALGRLTQVVIERAFPDEFKGSPRLTKGQRFRPGTPLDQTKNEPEEQRNVELHTRNDQRGQRTSRSSQSTLLREVGRGQASALQHRRSMLLALMSRARRSNTSSINDILNRDTLGSGRDDSIGHMMLPLDPFRQDAAAILFAPSGDYHRDGSWDGHDDGGPVEPSTDAESSILRSGESSTIPEERQASKSFFLDNILRGSQSKDLSCSSAGKLPAFQQSSALRSAIINGLLGNSLFWLKVSLDALTKNAAAKQSARSTPLLHLACDEDDTPILQLAISLGCSEAIVKHLILLGSPVGDMEIQMAATLDQPGVLSVLLQNSVYSDGVVDVDNCSAAIANVIREAFRRQKTQHEILRREAASFVVSFLRRLFQLGLCSRRIEASSDLCSRAVAEALVGNIMLFHLQKNQRQPATASLHEEVTEQSAQQSNAETAPFLDFECQGLVNVVPDAVFGESLAENPKHSTDFLLLIEDYLCSKEINDSAIGLTLLVTLLQRCPSLSRSLEMERYGIAELVSSHDAFASNRLAEISSRVSAYHVGSSPIEASKADSYSNDGIVLCPKRHAASIHITRHSSFRCDLCGKGVERGRVMHGCRECDWDACEKCTDRAEGGLVKWNHIRALASEAHRIMSDDELFVRPGEAFAWGEKLVQGVASMDNSSYVNNLSIRILQRDREAIKDLGFLMSRDGQLTMHQFLSVILPALHEALLGRANGKGGFNMIRPSFCRRSKKPRVVNSIMCPTEDAVQSSSNEDRLEFARVLVKYLVNTKEAPNEESKIGQNKNSTSLAERTDDGSSDDEMHDDDDDDDDDENETNQNPGMARNQHSELLRRLHKVLSLYENVPLLPKTRPKNGASQTKRGDLQSLIRPIEIALLPYANKFNSSRRSQNSLVIHVEPLLSVADLSLYILRTCRVSLPIYISFCRRLAFDAAIILERSFLPGESNNRTWRVAKVVCYDAENGWHSVQYATSCCHGRNAGLTSSVNFEVGALMFERKQTKLVLASREFYILHRSRPKSESTSKFDMDLLLSNSFVFDNEDEIGANRLHQSVGKRVLSNIVPPEWLPYTVLAIDRRTTNETSQNDERAEFTLVSDEGEVITNIQSTQIRGLPSDARAPDDDRRLSRGFGDEMAHGSRAQLSRTFPFLAVHRQSSEGQRRESSSVDSGKTLKRTWSALALSESMRPIDLNIKESRGGDGNVVINDAGLCQRKVYFGDREISLSIDPSMLESPPRLRVRYGSRQAGSPLEVSFPSDTTVQSLLWQIYDGEEEQIFGGDFFQVFYTVSCEPKKIESQKTDAGTSNERSWIDHRDEPPHEAKTSALASSVIEPCSSSLSMSTSVDRTARKLRQLTSYASSEDEAAYNGICDGLDEICVQCMQIVGLLADVSVSTVETPKFGSSPAIFENRGLSNKLSEQLEDPLIVVGGTLPDWCFVAPSFSPRIFSYEVRRLLLERAAFGVSRSTLKQQESKVNVGRLRQRMASLRARAVELVGEAFSGGAEDPTALQLQADELYGMEEALAARVRASFRAERWEEHALQVAKAAINRDMLISDAVQTMNQYAKDDRISRRRLEVRFDGESGFDAASGDEAGVTRGFYADVAEALLSCEIVAGASHASTCPDGSGLSLLTSMASNRKGLSCRLPLWIPDVDASGQVIIPTPRADPGSGLGVFPRPLSEHHPQLSDVLDQFRFMGRLFASAMRDGFMFPLPLSSSFLKLVRHGREELSRSLGFKVSINRSVSQPFENRSRVDNGGIRVSRRVEDQDIFLTSADLPRPGFLGGEIFAVESYICNALDELDQSVPPLTSSELERRTKDIASDKNFARSALGKRFDCSFEEYFQDRVFVDPLDPTQGVGSTPLCIDGHARGVTIENVREWVSLCKEFMLHDGVIAQAVAFRQGVEDFFSADCLRLFAPEELQRDVCGVGDNVDTWDETAIRKLFKLDGGKGAAEALVAVAAIGGEGGAALSRRFGPSSPTIKYVVKALLEATPKMRRQFLSFVTSVPIVTPGQIEVVPVVSPNGEFLPMRDPGCLPRANTCARRLYLPKFENYQSFSQVLWAVVGEESKFKGFYEWRGN